MKHVKMTPRHPGWLIGIESCDFFNIDFKSENESSKSNVYEELYTGTSPYYYSKYHRKTILKIIFDSEFE